MHIVTRLTANNQISISRYVLRQGMCGRNPYAKTQPEIDLLHESKLISRMEGLQKANKFCFPDAANLRTVTNNPRVGTTVLADISNGAVYLEKYSAQDLAEEYRLALDLLQKSQQAKKRERRWGLPQKEKVFSKAGADRILQGGAVIDKCTKRKNRRMITLTLPGSTWKAMDCLARWSGYVVNRLLQVVRRAQDDYFPIYWFFVWEHQKRGALHMHFALACDSPLVSVDEIAKRIKDKWFEVLLEFKERDGIDCFERKGFGSTWRNQPDKWQFDIAPIKYSVASYFAKYCAKNKKVTSKREDKSTVKTPISYPSRYWGSSSSIKKRLKVFNREARFTCYSEDEADLVLSRIIEHLLDDIQINKTWKYDFQVEIDNGSIVFSEGEVWGYAIPESSYSQVWHRFVANIQDRTPSEQPGYAYMQEISSHPCKK